MNSVSGLLRFARNDEGYLNSHSTIISGESIYKKILDFKFSKEYDDLALTEARAYDEHSMMNAYFKKEVYQEGE